MKEQVTKERMIEMGMDALDILSGIINSIPIYPRDDHSRKLLLGKSMSTQELYHAIKEMKKVVNTIDRYEVNEDGVD